MNMLGDHNYTSHSGNIVNCKSEPVSIFEAEEPRIQSQNLFNCATSSPELYICETCGFKANIRVLAHKNCPKTTQKIDLTKISFLGKYSCANCEFTTFSRLVYLHHIHMRCPMKSLHPESNSQKPERPNPFHEHNYCKRRQFETVFLTEDHSELIEEGPEKGASVDEANEQTETFLCNACPYFTTDKAAFVAHEHVVRDKFVRGIPRRYNCDKCSFEGYTRARLIRHKATQHPRKLNKENCAEKKSIKCKGCSFVAHSQLDLTEHMFRKTNILYQCTKCSFESRDIAQFKFHILTKHRTEGPQEYECQHCPFKTEEVHVLKCHIGYCHRQAAQRSLLVCRQCPFAAPSNLKMAQHTRAAHMIKCPHCYYCCFTSKELKSHIITRHKMKRCQHCSFYTRYKNCFLQHVQTHSIKCPCCTHLARTQMALSEHLVNAHQVYKCLYCNFRALQADKLDEHVVQRHVKCPRCPHSLYDVRALDRHIHEHHTFKCDVCGHVTSSQMDLVKHKKLKCKYCSHSTCSESALNKHVSRWHFRCTKCSFKCGTQKSLAKHYMLNHMAKWYECEACDYKDEVKDNMTEHILDKHTNAGQAFQCILCPFKTGRLADMDKHKMEKHQNDSVQAVV